MGRRGKETVNSLYGTRVAVLVGDFLFAQTSWGLAQLNDLEVIQLISKVIAEFANGEISQATSLFDCEVTLEHYLVKSFYKTASLMAATYQRQYLVKSTVRLKMRCFATENTWDLRSKL